jgi:peptidoglycan/LPS O-acetylase OafA/YrhL
VPLGALAALAVRSDPAALAPGRRPGACRSVSIGLVINPLLQALTEPLRPDQLGDANTLFNTWQRIAGSFGIGLLAALYATQSRTHGPVPALHLTGLVLAAIAATGALAALALPALPNIALSRD